eukprot:CAMPEP_0206037236 /NCGR_PEP_ID=MMETSP1466-20131121/3316_1 /ASSEMBLY_ACC=CAM_ASM_001126 /TAXON_ID=44452 /ORGANISM="Pavlova gyrans, Strain CCMP608" /LENGTH=82 /DNA_ID=CAMNT_0053411781 /DNA_START=31 /DNA_END=279 /DNA_ORIENTATION=-
MMLSTFAFAHPDTQHFLLDAGKHESSDVLQLSKLVLGQVSGDCNIPMACGRETSSLARVRERAGHTQARDQAARIMSTLLQV